MGKNKNKPPYWKNKCEHCYYLGEKVSSPGLVWDCLKSGKPIKMVSIESCDGPYKLEVSDDKAKG